MSIVSIILSDCEETQKELRRKNILRKPEIVINPRKKVNSNKLMNLILRDYRFKGIHTYPYRTVIQANEIGRLGEFRVISTLFFKKKWGILIPNFKIRKKFCPSSKKGYRIQIIRDSRNVCLKIKIRSLR